MRFFFTLAGAVHDPDNDGVELATISDARVEAARLAGEMLRDRPELAWLDEFRIEGHQRPSVVVGYLHRGGR